MSYLRRPFRRLSRIYLRQAALFLPALLLLLLVWVPAAWLPPSLAFAMAFALLLLYPGYLLLILLRGERGLGPTVLPIAFCASLGLWFLPVTAMQVVKGSLDALLLLCALSVLLLAIAVLWGVAPTGRQRDVLPWLPALLRRLRGRSLFLWASDFFFWGATVAAVAVFVHYASMWRPTDRWTYQGYILALLDNNNVAPPFLLGGRGIPERLELSPWLVLLAALQRLSAAPLAALYNFYLPPLLLLLALCSALLLGRQVLNGRWAAAVAVLLLVLYWLTDIALPMMAPFSWQERMLLRLEGGQSTLGQWALLGRIVEDKFLLIFVLLPTFQALLLRYLGRGGRTRLLLLALAMTAVVLLHPLGIAFASFSFAALLPFQLLKLRTPATRRTLLLRLGAPALLLVLALLIPLYQRQQVAAADMSGRVFSMRGDQSMIDYLLTLGLWTSPASDSFYALHPYLIGRRAMLVLALLLLPLVLLVRRLRKPGVQFLSGMIALSALVTFNPWVAPLLGRLITPNMLFRTWWLVVLPAILVLALAVQTGVALLRRRLAPSGTGVTTGRRTRAALAFAPLLLVAALALPLWPQIDAGQRLLGEIQAHSLSAADLALLAYLRENAPAGSVVVAPEWLSNELPALVGRVRAVAFRDYSIQPSGWTLRDFYAQDQVDVTRLQRLAEYGADLVVAPLPSVLDQQLAHLGPPVTPVYANDSYRLYALADGWQADPALASLLAAADALTAGHSTTAVALARQALAVDPGNYTAAQALAAALTQAGDFTQAQAALDAIPPGAANAAWLGQLRAAVYRGQAAVAQGRGASPLTLATLYRRALAADPADLESGRALAELDAAAGGKLLQPAEEEAILAAFAAQVDPSAHPEAYFPPSNLQRSAIWSLAAIFELLGRNADAEQTYRSAFDLARPQAGEGAATAELGRFLVRQGRTAEATSLYQESLSRNRDAKELHAALADLAALAAGPEAAAAVWRDAAAANPYAPWPYIALARLDLQAASRAASANTLANLPAAAPIYTSVTSGASPALDPLEQAVVHLDRAIALDATAAEPYWLLTEAYMRLDDPTAVRAVWERATTANPQSAWAWLALAGAVRDEDDYTALAAVLENALRALPPDEQTVGTLAADLAHVQAARAAQAQARAYITGLNHYWPAVDLLVVDHSLPTGWTLVALGVDREALWSAQPIPLWLFWQAPDTAATAGAAAAGWQQLAPALWVQAVPAAANLVPDGGFERSASQGRIIGFPDDPYGADSAARQVQTVTRGGAATAAALLANRLAYLNSSFVTLPLAVDQHTVYLQMGALRSEGGSGYLGLRWEGESGQDLGENQAVMGETRPVWRYAAQLVQPPPDATSVRVLLLNLQATGDVYFDNILLLPLDEPGR